VSGRAPAHLYVSFRQGEPVEFEHPSQPRPPQCPAHVCTGRAQRRKDSPWRARGQPRPPSVAECAVFRTPRLIPIPAPTAVAEKRPRITYGQGAPVSSKIGVSAHVVVRLRRPVTSQVFRASAPCGLQFSPRSGSARGGFHDNPHKNANALDSPLPGLVERCVCRPPTLPHPGIAIEAFS